MARVHGRHRARRSRARGQPVRRPCVLLSGGETTVTVRGQGRGGRNAEFLLALARRARRPCPAYPRWPATPTGSTAPRTIAGAIADARTALRAPRAAGIDAQAMLADNDGYGFFARSGT